jgi:hypothetical protein
VTPALSRVVAEPPPLGGSEGTGSLFRQTLRQTVTDAPETRYARSAHRTNLAYQVSGEGPLDLVLFGIRRPISLLDALGSFGFAAGYTPWAVRCGPRAGGWVPRPGRWCQDLDVRLSLAGSRAIGLCSNRLDCPRLRFLNAEAAASTATGGREVPQSLGILIEKTTFISARPVKGVRFGEVDYSRRGICTCV